MAKESEDVVRDKCKLYIKRLGYTVTRLEPHPESGIDGQFDLLVYHKSFGSKHIEVKTDTGKLSGNQRLMQHMLGDQGLVVYGYNEDTKKKIKKFLEGE